MPLTRVFGSTQPVSTDLVGAGYTNLDDLSDDISERITLDHYMDGELTDDLGDQDGRHRQVTLYNLSSAPSAKVDTGSIYTKKNSDDTVELFYEDNDGVEQPLLNTIYSSEVSVTWTCPESRYYEIQMVGRGGSGRSTGTYAGGGGASAYGFIRIWIEEDDVWTKVNGAGNGTFSTFSNDTTTLSIEDGYDGEAPAGGLGGETGTGFDFVSPGGDGTNYGGTYGGNGGASFFGGGGRGGTTSGNAAENGKAYGSGGGGAGYNSSGGTGGFGLVLIKAL